MATMPLKQVDKVEILTILDNTIDLLMAGTEQVKRLPLPPDAVTREHLVAEHGFAALVTVTSGRLARDRICPFTRMRRLPSSSRCPRSFLCSGSYRGAWAI